MKIRRLAVPLAWLLIAATTSVFMPESAASARALQLGRHNVISGTASTRTEVALSRKIEIANPMLRESNFRIRSRARFAGFALVYKNTLETWVGGRVKEGRDEVYFFVSLDPFNQAGDAPETHRLPAGEYDLFVLADTARAVRVELNLEQLRGSVSIRSVSRAEAQVKFPTIRSLDTGSNIHWVDATGRIPSKSGAQLIATWFTTTRHAVTSYESCFYKGRVPEPDRSVPACAAFNAADMHEGNTGLRVSTYPRIVADRGRLFIPAGRIYSPGEGWTPGRFSGALSVRTAAVEGKPRALALWLGF